VGVLVIILIVGVVVTLMVFSYLQAEQRKKDLAAWATSRGLCFCPTDDSGMENRFPGFQCLQYGSSRYAYNISEGMIGQRPVHAFDYHYETESTDSDGKTTTTSHAFSAVVVSTNLPLKPLAIRSEGFFDRVAAFLGFEDIDFESTEFSRQFHVTSPDRRWAYDVLPQSTLEFLLDSPRFLIELCDCQLIAYREQTFKPADFDAALQVIEGILERLPASLVQELKGAG
jgi:hypothetical protein